MLYIITILVVLLAAIGIAVLVKRRIDRDLLESNQPKNLMDTNLRPLFEAEEEDVRVLDKDADALEAEVVDDEHEKKLAKLDEFRQTWTANPNKRGAVRLLALGADCESAAAYADIVSAIIGEWRAGRLDGLGSGDLAELIETHLWLLPPTERMSGDGFVVKQEISVLRSK